MTPLVLKVWMVVVCLCAIITATTAQTYLTGEVLDATNGEPLVGASVVLAGTTVGTITDYDGKFTLQTEAALPIKLEISFIGYNTQYHDVASDDYIKIKLGEDSEVLSTVEIKGRRISEKQRESPLTVESLDIVAIKETPAANFYDGLGALKDVDLTAASLGFKIVNTRGFNSTSPVRSLQLIDGIDNQSPGLNFSLGNFLGASELDLNKVDLIVGASSAFYGPGAFNGVISMSSKDPFFHKGLAVQLKVGERNLMEGALRYATTFKDKSGSDRWAFKLNAFGMRADDWEADTYTPIPGTQSEATNPGGFDAVNIYGDEYNQILDASGSRFFRPGLGVVHRTGYQEADLVDYDTENAKLSGAIHYRLKPSKTFESPELILSSNYGGGTTVYQGDNRFSLRNIQFYQHRIELKKKNKYFVRGYVTHEDAGDSFDPYFTALQLQDQAKDDEQFRDDYFQYWLNEIKPRIESLEGYPDRSSFPDDQSFINAFDAFIGGINDSLQVWHNETRTATDRDQFSNALPRFEPGTAAFDSAFNDITSRIASAEDGTRFYDRSALYHLHGEYIFNNVLTNTRFIENMDIRTGANYRMYLPDSRGSILQDTNGRNIDTYEYGIYGGATITSMENRLKVNLSGRVDDHENFDPVFSPAASFVYSPAKDNFFRVNFSSGVRIPTLTEQYLNYNVGPAVLLGNIDGFDSLLTTDSYISFLNTSDRDTLNFFDVAPLVPERVRTIEVGYRTILFDKLYVDAGYYHSWYDDFIGFEIGVDAEFNLFGIPTDQTIYRVSANARDQVKTQGFSIGANYYFRDKMSIVGNYSFNQLTTSVDDPIVPAYNTPEHKYNIGVNGRDIPMNEKIKFGFNVNYRWQEAFQFEGSPQFTGTVPAYGLLDAQVNWIYTPLNLTLKIGASNVLDERVIQAFGGPRIGRFTYASILYEWRNDK